MALTIENENTLKASLAQKINLFVGSGFSVLAKNSQSQYLPIGEALKAQIIKHFDEAALSALTLPQVCTIIQRTRKEELDSFLREMFTVKSIDPKYEVLLRLPINTVFTTNIDNLVPKIFAESPISYLNDIHLSGPSFADRVAVDYVPLHGSVDHDSGFTFSPIEIASSFSQDRDKWSFLTTRLQQTVTIFIGYRMEDAGILEALNPATTHNRLQKDRWVVLRNSSEAERAYFKALNFNLILGDTADTLDWFSSIARGLAPTDKIDVNSHPALKDFRIPNRASVPVRPISHFFNGAAPTWADVFSNRIFRTSHFAKISEAIHSKRNVAVLGMFASGKTTLMLQVASLISFNGTKLVCPAVTLDRARLIVRALQGGRALIFIDDFADYVEAFNYLCAHPNIQIIGFERNYSYDNVSHLVESGKLTFIDCTDLTQEDIQGIFNTIPRELKKRSLVVPKTNNGIPPSLYEVVESNMLQPTLTKLFKRVLEDLADKDPILHDFLVMCSYVHDCRTPVSFDMAYAFLRRDITGHGEVYKVVKALETLVVSADPALIDEEQDYFVPRSALIASAVLESVQGEAFKRVLVRFTEEVSQFRISRFDVFKRRGYDEHFASKAFSLPAEGIQYYETLIAKDQSPFLYQQAALYLARKRRYRDAFQWIDQAIQLSGNKIPSIRNSHAVILFRANIDLAGTKSQVVVETLRQSMEILRQCYIYDKRKNYHAMRFGEQAVQYWNVFGDETAKSYLDTAQKWLREETKRSPWHRGTRYLSQEVTKLLGA